VKSASLGARALRRYSRHLLIPEVGLVGQELLASSRILVIGAGGLGSPALQYLAAAGVGRIGVADGDTVDETNLQRQTIFNTSDVGRSKAEVAADRLHALNPLVAVDAIAVDVDERNVCELVRLYDVVLDCTDRFQSRYLINDACILEGKPDVYGSIFRFDGQVSVFGVSGGACYRCLYPEPPPPGSVPTCAEGGVLGALAGIVGAWQASEALKVVLGIGEPLSARLMLIETLGARVREVRFDRDPHCRLCGEEPSIRRARAIAYDDTVVPSDLEELEPGALDDALATALLLDVREPHEAVLGSLDGAVEIPASQLDARMHELDTAQRYVVACRVGVKSQWAARRLREAGFKRLLHLRGGLLAYAAQHPEFEFF
jgi:molybdopterin/thiamine biosynthesis adenylyltransferase/rhodanese-related sulfurtransferase